MDRLVPVPPPETPAQPDDALRGIEIVTMREVVEEAPAEEPAPVPEVVPEEPAVEPEPPAPEPAEVPRPAPPAEPADEEVERIRGATAGERLRPRMGDPRLWAPIDREYTELTDEERAELMLHGMIRTWSDSVAVAAALRADAMDWTHTDEDGRRWGLSPGRLHLGDFSIPLPFQFQSPAAHRERNAQRQWELDDILRGAAAAEVRETWAERAREIRERMEEDRRRNRGGG